MVQLPLRVNASGRGPARSFDLSNEVERIELYEIVLTDGTAEDVLPLCQSGGAATALAPAVVAATCMTNTLYSPGREAAGLVCLQNYPQSLQHITRPDGEVIDLAAIDVLRNRERGVPATTSSDDCCT
jgi:hypothetical protein